MWTKRSEIDTNAPWSNALNLNELITRGCPYGWANMNVVALMYCWRDLWVKILPSPERWLSWLSTNTNASFDGKKSHSGPQLRSHFNWLFPLNALPISLENRNSVTTPIAEPEYSSLFEFRLVSNTLQNGNAHSSYQCSHSTKQNEKKIKLISPKHVIHLSLRRFFFNSKYDVVHNLLFHSFATKIDDFLEYKWSSTFGEFGFIQIIKTVVNGHQIDRPHMLSSIDAETGYSDCNQFIHKLHDHTSNMRISLI